MIAADLAIDVKTAALLSTAFAFPYALVQPVLGVTGDFFGKTRLMNLCVLVMAIATLVCAVATNFWLLVAMRIAAGLVAGGVFPVAMALLGDLVPIHQRQVAIARLLGVALTANVLGASIAGIIGDLFGWRGVFARARAVLARGGADGVLRVPQHHACRSRRRSTAPPSSPTSATSSPTHAPRSASARCSSKRSSSTGCFPMSALLLQSIGETRASIAGLLIACFAVGGIGYSLVVPYLAGRVPSRRLMLTGGSGCGLVPRADRAAFSLAGAGRSLRGVRLGFYLLHGCIQVHVTDLSQTARGAAASLHSSSFYLGQAIGPGDLRRSALPMAGRSRRSCSARWWCSASASCVPGCCAAGPDSRLRHDAMRWFGGCVNRAGVLKCRPMNRTLNILSFLIFASALSVRAIDPVVPQIAADFVGLAQHRGPAGRRLRRLWPRPAGARAGRRRRSARRG